MNTQSLSVALAAALAAGALLSSAASAQSPVITTLPTTQVRPDADQLAQLRHEATSGIPTLPGITVRPDTELLRQIAAERVMAERIVTLSTVEVRPSAEQRAERTALSGQAAVAATTVDREPVAHADGMAGVFRAAEAIIRLPSIDLRPVLGDLSAVSAVAGKLR